MSNRVYNDDADIVTFFNDGRNNVMGFGNINHNNVNTTR